MFRQISVHPLLISTTFSWLVHWYHSFCLYQQNKSSESKVKYIQASNHCKTVLEASKLVYAKKTKGLIISKKRCFRNLSRIANSVLNKGKSAIPSLLYLICSGVLPSASDKAKLFPKNFSKNSSLNDSGISLPSFHSRTNLKLNNICVTPKMVKRSKQTSSKAPSLDYIPCVVLKNC